MIKMDYLLNFKGTIKLTAFKLNLTDNQNNYLDTFIKMAITHLVLNVDKVTITDIFRAHYLN